LQVVDVPHRQLAVDLFNHVWTLLDKPLRTPEQDDEMLHAAHASRHHWLYAGTTINLARGEWQCSRVYAMLGRAEPALHHALRCRDYVEAAEDAEDWDLPFAYEAIARAFVVAGDEPAAAENAQRARELAAAVSDDGDREQLLGELAELP
jgi:hypothetical protein